MNQDYARTTNFKERVVHALEDFEFTLDYGVRGPFRLLQHWLPSMIEQKYGRIVSILPTLM